MAARGDAADFIALAIEYPCAFADRLAAFDEQSDTFLGGPIVELGHDSQRSSEAAFGATALADSEGQIRHHRRSRAAEVMPVERKPRLKPQRIARAKADGPHPLVGD